MHQTRALPPLTTLRSFCAIAETGAFGRAAERLGLTQTAISHQMAQLEDWLGARLFDRGRHGATLTLLGRQLLPEISRALAGLDAALWTARLAASEETLTLSVTPEFFSQWLSARLPGFCDSHPAIKLRLVVNYRAPSFADDGLDLAIWLGAAGPDFASEPVGRDEEFAVCSPAVAARLPPREALRAAPLLTYRGARHTALDWQRWFEQALDATNPAFAADMEASALAARTYESFPAMLAACREGEGFALVRDSLVRDDLDAGTLVRAFVETMPAAANYALTYPPGALAAPAARAFRDWLLSAA